MQQTIDRRWHLQHTAASRPYRRHVVPPRDPESTSVCGDVGEVDPRSVLLNTQPTTRKYAHLGEKPLFAFNFWSFAFISDFLFREVKTSSLRPHCSATVCHACSRWPRADKSGVQWFVCCIVCGVPLCPPVSSVSR